MVISNETKKEMKRAKDFTITSKYIVLYNGSSVIIYDKHFVFLKKITGLKFVYKGYVSPDEKKLLLVSNTNRIYLVSLENLDIVLTYIVPKPYNDNLEGRACWYSNDSFLLPIQNKATMLSTVRKITCNLDLLFEDFLSEKFWIIYISFVECQNQYLIIGSERNTQQWNIIWLDKENNYTVNKILGFDEAIFDVTLIDKTGHIILTGETRMHYCNFNGFPIRTPQMLSIDISQQLGHINFIKYSKYELDKVYLGTSNALIACSLSRQSITNFFSLEFGAHNVEELSNDTFLVSTWNGIKLFSIAADSI